MKLLIDTPLRYSETSSSEEAEVIRTGKAFDKVKTIKLADCIDNCISIGKHDPKFAVTYFDEKRDLLPYLVGGDEKLYKMLKDILK